MKPNLVQLDQRALELRNKGCIREALELFSEIVKEQPNWEHGQGFYNLANCYEDVGEFHLAEKAYETALSFQPANSVFVGGFASFLYLHGDPKRAFSCYLDFLEIEHMSKDETGAELSKTALLSLGKRLGLSEAEVAARIKERLL